MLDSINHQEMVQLLESKGGPHLSILLTAPLKPSDAKNDAIRLKNILRDSRGHINRVLDDGPGSRCLAKSTGRTLH